MNLVDFLLLAVLAAGVYMALRAIRRGRTGGCSGQCAGCSGCAGCTGQISHSAAEIPNHPK